MSKTENQKEFLEEIAVYGRMFDCVAFDSMGECSSKETSDEPLHPASFCLHPENGGPKHGCDLFDTDGRLIPDKTCLYRVRVNEPRADELRKIANWEF